MGKVARGNHFIVDGCNDVVHRLRVNDGREHEDAEGQAYSRNRAAKATHGIYRPIDGDGCAC
jgi:hypothetical protein